MSTRVAATAVKERPADPPTPRARPQSAVPPPAPVPAPRAAFVVLVLLVVVGGVLGILLLNTKINEDAFRLHELREQQAVLDQRQQELETRIAEANSTANLTAAARRQGLVQVPFGETGRIRLPGGDVVGDPAPVDSQEQGVED